MTTIATHDGVFHADDVFAVATLRLVCDDAAIIRTRDPERIATADLRVDVGGASRPQTGDFDHHQREGAGVRANGVPFAAFGLVWAEFGERVVEMFVTERDAAHITAVARLVDERLVQVIDAHDTGASKSDLSAAITLFNPTWQQRDPDAADAAFFRTVVIATEILAAAITTADAEVAAREIVHQAVERANDPRIIVLDRPLPWQAHIHDLAPDALLVVMPAPNQVNVQVVPQTPGTFTAKRPLPAAWAGLSGEALAAVTGVADAVFCHRGRFIAAARSLDGARALAQIALRG